MLSYFFAGPKSEFEVLREISDGWWVGHAWVASQVVDWDFVMQACSEIRRVAVSSGLAQLSFMIVI